jgi:hypothetical protein
MKGNAMRSLLKTLLCCIALAGAPSAFGQTAIEVYKSPG